MTLTDADVKIEARGRVKQCDETHKERCDCGAPCWCECITDIAALRTSRERLANVERLLKRWQTPSYISQVRSSSIVRGSSEVWKAATTELRAALGEEATS